MKHYVFFYVSVYISLHEMTVTSMNFIHTSQFQKILMYPISIVYYIKLSKIAEKAYFQLLIYIHMYFIDNYNVWILR